LSGNKRAERALREFEAFASRNMTKQLEIVFVDNEYTTAFAAARFEDKSV
jgi:ribosomal protein L31E